MPSSSEKMAHLFYRVHVLGDQEYGKTRGITPETAAKMHAEDRQALVFFNEDGDPTYDVENPLNKEEMAERAKLAKANANG